MSKLNTYRIRYRVTESYYVDVEASTSKHAADWLRTLLEIGSLAVHNSKYLHSECSIGDIQIKGMPVCTRLPVL